MASEGGSSGNGQIDQLNSARNLALSDPAMYSKLLPAILPILNSSSNPTPELRAWGADFLAEAFSSPMFSSEGKQDMSVRALPVVKDLLELQPGAQYAPMDQTGMIKSAIQAASSIYPFIFRHM
jgi:symplekin